jgi:hypothetical protein
MAHLNQRLLLNTKKTQQCHIPKSSPIFLFNLHQGMVIKEYQYVTKMKNVIMGSLWKYFITTFYITKYLQRSVYIWSKISKCIIFQCGMDFQYVPLMIIYSF